MQDRTICPILIQEATMLAISGIETSTTTTRTLRTASAERREAPSAPARALVAVEAVAPSERICVPRRGPLAPFLAHLIATRAQAPQTRTRRRGEPHDALAAYGTRPAPARGRHLSRDV
jgi:hypothetical protein